MSDQHPWSGEPTTEHLQAEDGTPLARARGRGRKGLLIGGCVAALAMVGGGVWAWQAYVGQGPQPAEALPADTVAYISVDLDPSGKQKIEALRTLRTFPGFKDEVDLDTDDDLRKKLFEAVQDDGFCSDLDYDDDVDPWLGDRAAVAVLDAKAEQPVLVVQVKDQDKAEEGLDSLVNCGGDAAGESEEIGGYAFTGDWVVLAQTEEIAAEAVAAAEKSSLSDDEDYDRWTSALGDAGVINLYAAPEAGEALTTIMEGELGSESPAIDDEARKVLKDFPGAAATVRFNDGALELEAVSSQVDKKTAQVLDTDRGADAVSTLPDSTAVALGAGMGEGWGQVLLDQLAPMIEKETGMTVDEAVAEAEAEIGINLPEDVETLLGESFTLALDSGFDEAKLVGGPGPDDIPAGVKVEGDPDQIEPVLEKMRSSMTPGAAEALQWKVEGDHVVIGFDSDYLDTMKDEGDLGDSDVFEKVIPEADDSAALIFANFDADDWLVRVVTEAGAPAEVIDNVKPLEAFGISSWTDGDDAHVLLKVTTED